MCSIDYCEPAEVYREEHRRARKEYECYECQRVIERRERYLFCSMLYEGRWSSYRMCAHCQVGAHWLTKVCGGYTWGNVLEELVEHWDEEWHLRTQDLGRYIILSGKKHGTWCRVDRWRLDGQLIPVPSAIRVRDRLRPAA